MNQRIRNTADLLASMAAGHQPHFLYFWGHTARAGGIDKSCLSQWYPASFTLDGAVYHTAEHYMMAEKARLFGDTDIAARVLATTDPKEAKQLGRQVRGFDRAMWEAACERIVFEGNLGKFAQNEALRDFLLATGDQVLVEASPVDDIWGIGLAEDAARAVTPSDWKGKNLLGYALMEVRAALDLDRMIR